MGVFFFFLDEKETKNQALEMQSSKTTSKSGRSLSRSPCRLTFDARAAAFFRCFLRFAFRGEDVVVGGFGFAVCFL